MGGARADVVEYDGAVGGCRDGPPPLLLLLLLLVRLLAPSATAAGSVLCIAWRESVPALRPFFALSFSVACDCGAASRPRMVPFGCPDRAQQLSHSHSADAGRD